MKNHPVKLSDKDKESWFRSLVDERQRVSPLKTEEELVEFVRFCRKMFRQLYGRDVSGSFFRLLLNDFGVARAQSASVKKKRDFIFALLDENQAFRDSKAQLKKAVNAKFGEKILGIVFDEIWNEYHEDKSHPTPKKNIDLFGQPSLFGED
jgi:hypothetical protein